MLSNIIRSTRASHQAWSYWSYVLQLKSKTFSNYISTPFLAICVMILGISCPAQVLYQHPTWSVKDPTCSNQLTLACCSHPMKNKSSSQNILYLYRQTFGHHSSQCCMSRLFNNHRHIAWSPPNPLYNEKWHACAVRNSAFQATSGSPMGECEGSQSLL